MKTLRTVESLRAFVADQRAHGKTVGLVPTMGALHDGHLSLVHKAVKDNDVVVASVFVNPTQFNNPTDLQTYPRNEAADLALLEGAGVEAVFAPSVEEIYPNGPVQEKTYDLGQVAEVMEGRHRPGHFQGVAQIVNLLFRLVEPDRAYFGEKDFQQIAVIRRMVATEGLDLEIVACPIKRADDGLALSSRNALLTTGQRQIAPEIHKALAYSVEYAKEHPVKATIDTVVERINALPECEVEYYEIVDDTTLQPVDEWDQAEGIVGCITVYCGKVRLIDNIRYK